MTTAFATQARKKPRQARSKRMVETILDATARILVRHGFSGTTTGRVAERAGISIGSLYQYFPSREALVAAVAQRHSETMKASLEALVVQTRTVDLKTALHLMLRAIADAHAAAPELSHILATQLPSLGAMDWRHDVAARAIGIVQSVLAAHAGDLRHGLDVASAAFVVAKSVEAVSIASTQCTDADAAAAITASLLQMLMLFLVADPTGCDRQL